LDRREILRRERRSSGWRPNTDARWGGSDRHRQSAPTL